MKRLVLLLTTVAVTASATISARQSPGVVPANTIWVTANVTHDNGKLVADMTAADFAVTDNGQPREITVFRNDPIPIAVAVMVDVSSSMEANYGLVKRAVTALISHFAAGDRAIIGSFDALPWIGSRFSARPDVLQQSLAAALSVTYAGGTLALCDGDWIDKTSTRYQDTGRGFGAVNEFSRRLKIHGGSAIWDGAACGINAVASDGETPRRILIVVTDAEDTMSSTTVPQLIDRANRSGVIIYSIAVMGGYGMAGGALKGLATATGGGYFYLTGENEAADAFTRIGDELRHQYVLGFAADGSVAGTHNIVVTSRRPNTTAKSRRVFMDAPAVAPAPARRTPAPVTAPPPVPQSLALPPVDDEARAAEAPSPLPTGEKGRTLTWQRLDEMLDRTFELGQQPRLKIGEMRALLGLLKKDAGAWIRAVPSADQPRRRLAAALFALDLLYTQNDPFVWTGGQPAPDFIDWAAGVLDDGPPTPEEKLWCFGAIALFERAGAPAPLERFLLRAEKRFPGEARWTLARAVAQDLRTWPEERDLRPFRVDPAITGPLVSRYESAIAQPAVTQEAQLRLGYFELRRGRVDDAIARLSAAAAAEPDDVILRFWVHLMFGRALDQSGKLDDAIAQYSAALDAGPGAPSATSALIAALSKAHRPGDAARIAAAALANPAAVLDPWTIYVLPDFRFWPGINEQLQQAVVR